MKLVKKAVVAAVLISVAGVSPVFATSIPVVDIALNTQTKMNQVENIAKLVAQLQQLKAQVQAITGDRGMGGLLSGQNRGYLPPDWNQAMNVLNSSSSSPYSALANAAQSIKTAQSVLSTADVNNLTPQMQQLLNQARNASATQQALGQAAYQQASQRVGLLQQLTNAISGASDAKAVMDLQARIQSEQTMLQNDQSKLQSLAQLQQAQDVATRQMHNEMRAQTSGAGTFPTIDTSINR